MKSSLHGLFAFALTLAALGAPAAAAYETIAVPNGGTLSILVLTGGGPKQVTTTVAKDSEQCGTSVTTGTVEVTRAGGLRNAVVYIETIDKGKSPDTSRVRFDNRGCQFVPHVLTMTAGQTLEITNSDPILHNTHATIGERTVFNLALPVQNQKVTKKIVTPGAMNVKCDAGHTWMNAWIHAFPHPYHAVTDKQGKARIAGVPPGTYKVTAWHEELGTQTLEVVIQPSTTAEMTFKQLAQPKALQSP